MTTHINQFCETMDPNQLLKLADTHIQEISEIVTDMDKGNLQEKIPEDKKHLFYILYSYFRPTQLISDAVLSQPTFTAHLANVAMFNFCKAMSKMDLSRDMISKLFYTVYDNLVMQGLKPDLSNVDNKYLNQLYRTIDLVYFERKIEKYLAKTNTKVDVFIYIKGETFGDKAVEAHKVIGAVNYCQKVNKCYYRIVVDPSSLINAFTTKKYKRQELVGKTIYNALEGLILCMQHEVTHMVISYFCASKEGKYDPLDPLTSADHPIIFLRIVRSLFGHTRADQSIGRHPDTGVKREDIKNWRGISWEVHDDSGTFVFYHAKILRLLPNSVEVQMPKGIFYVKYSGIFREEPDPRLYEGNN